MIMLKSTLIALLTLVATGVLMLLAFVVRARAGVPLAPGTTIGVDPVSIARSFPAVWLVPVLISICGFAWEYNRLRKKKSARQV